MEIVNISLSNSSAKLKNVVKLLLVCLMIIVSNNFPKNCVVEGALKLKSGQHLDSFLKSYESIALNPIDEPISGNSELAAKDHENLQPNLKIEAFGKNFAVYLHRGDSVFTDNAKVVIHDADSVREIDVADLQTNFVEGYLLDEDRSDVRGHVNDGAFAGTISLQDENYYVEPAATYFEDAGALDAIMYKESDVNYPAANSSRLHASFCYSGGRNRSDGARPAIGIKTDGLGMQPQAAKLAVGKVCKMKVVADHYFFQDYSQSNLRTAVANMEYHVQEADRIYRTVDFDDNGRPDNVRIRVARAEVWQSPDDKQYFLGDPYLNASAYLERMAFYDHNGYCAAMSFSHRVFDDDVLGYAYRGAPQMAGGICYPRQFINKKMRSLNVGMTTFKAKWGAMLKPMSTVLVAHELGHMFGSPHDDEADGGKCFMEPQERHFIMSAVANKGVSANNRQFSKCSVRYMNENMQTHGACLVCRGKECGGGGRTASWPLAAYMTIVLCSVLFGTNDLS